MSRRKQTNPFKVNWPFHMTGFSGPQHASEMEAKDDFAENPACHSVTCGDLDDQDGTTDDSDSDLDKENSSSSSGDDNMVRHKASQCSDHGGGMKEESEMESDLGGNYSCPICTLEFGSPDLLIAHVYQHTSTVGGSKSYVCPVCGRALSSPGSLGRHLLIHSDDRLSNCAVCGARFTDTNNFNREKLKEFLSGSDLESRSEDQTCPMVQAVTVTDDHMAIQGTNHGAAPGSGFPVLSGGLLSSGSLLPPFPDSLNQLPDLLNTMPVYPAGVLLVCNSCAAYQQLAGSPSSAMRKWASRRRNEPTEARLQRLERERVAKKSKRERETSEERELRRLRDREAKRMQRLQETQEQRARRLQRDREAMRLKRATETPERRQARLVREREAKRLKRRLDKIEPSLRAQIEHDPAAVAALTADVNLFQFPFPVSSMDNGLFMKLP
ncbi:zinc finger protein 821 isoform X1 [Silurus meridionalis]|uniref:C2H2-type domain-containing protein n=2 Tax=Silurus meridionalis TaxID=175797 RepID=A0A8T0B932_SILME|nr:zinc finger protein 821 isoform X1 [Silurus meridionalis]XP_046714146.1 zinc finger protein 821 isoform X1 [Silurus meridionalis]KAF7703404.1 hypothetical protein HF521_022411 [Silurus meridionalis]